MKKLLLYILLLWSAFAVAQPTTPVGPAPTQFYHDNSTGNTWIYQGTAPYNYGWLNLNSLGGVTSVFGRTGVVTAVGTDYMSTNFKAANLQSNGYLDLAQLMSDPVSPATGYTRVYFNSANLFSIRSSSGQHFSFHSPATGATLINFPAISPTINLPNSLIPTAVKTGAYTAVSWDFVTTNTTSGVVPITLPTAPPDYTIIGVKMVIVGGTNATTITTGGSDVFNKTGGSTTVSLTTTNQSFLMEYVAGIWYITSGDASSGGTTTNALTNGFGINTFSFNGGSAQTVIADTAVLTSQARLATNLTGYLKKTGLTATSPLAYNSGTGAFSIQVSNGSQNGYLSSSDWTTFNSKQQAITLTTIGTSGAATLSGPTLNIPQYSGNNIYNSNGTLTGIRNVSNGGFRLGISDSLYVSVPNAMHTYSGASIPFFGTSITVGFFANPITTLKYSTLVSTFLGVTENNLGTSGMHVQETGDGFAFQDHETSVPSYSSSTMPYGMVLELGPNDFNSYTGGGGTYQPTQYTTDLTSLLTYLTVTKGYPASKILVLSNSYYGTFGYTATKTAAIYATYRANSASVAATFGCPYLDIFTYFQNRGGNALLFSDQLHPNNRGHAVEANAVESVLAPATTYRAAQNFATQFGEFATMKLNNTTTLPDSVNTIIGRNSTTGMLGSLNSLPSNISANNLFWRGVQIDTGFYYNYTPGHQDIIKGQSSSIIGQYLTNPAFYTKLQLVDGNVGFVFSTIGNNVTTSPIATFSSPSQSTAVKILQSGQIVANSIAFPNFGNSFSITATGGSATGTLTPFGTAINSDFATVIGNGYSGANIVFNTSRGVNNTITEAGRFSIQGNFLSKTTIDDGFSPEAFIAARFQQGFNIGRISKVTTFANPTPLTTGGTIAAGPRFYKILATDAFGKTTEISSVEATCTTTGTTSSVPITWTAVTGASGYRVYEGPTSGGENQYISSVTNSVTDIGSGYTSGTPPTQNTTSYGKIDANGNATLPTVSITSAQTVVSGSTSGNATFSEPFQGSSYKKVVIFLNALSGIATYTYPVSFTQTPVVVSTSGLGTGLVTSISTTALTVTASGVSGILLVEGY